MRSPRSRTTAGRAGLTLVETILAIVVLGAGLLAIAGGTTATIRLAADGGVRTMAAGVALSVADSLRARPCTTLVDGSGRARGIDAWWTVAAAPDARLVRVVVAFDGARGRRQLTFDVAVPCRLP